MGIRQTAMCVGLLAALASPDVGHGQSESAELECIDRAQDRTLLDENEGSQLCDGARSLAPVECYQGAIDRALIDTHDAVQLCRCAESTEPVDCFIDARERLPSDVPEAVRVCSPIVRRKLESDCTPTANVPAPRQPGSTTGAAPTEPEMRSPE